MQFLSELQYGVYAECYEDTHPEILTRYAADSDDANNIDVQAEIAADQDRHIRHAAVDVPQVVTPFHSAEAHEAFTLALQAAQDQGLIPIGYGVAEEEWVDGYYPKLEVIPVGHSAKDYEVHLPFSIWWPRAVRWVQGLDVMTHICMIEAGEL